MEEKKLFAAKLDVGVQNSPECMDMRSETCRSSGLLHSAVDSGVRPEESVCLISEKGEARSLFRGEKCNGQDLLL